MAGIILVIGGIGCFALGWLVKSITVLDRAIKAINAIDETADKKYKEGYCDALKFVKEDC